MGYFIDVGRSAWSIAVGLWTTLKNLFRPTVTVQYPERRLAIPKGFRGMPALLADEETGKPKCTACGICARTCPLGIITVQEARDEKGKRILAGFGLDMGRCMACNLCVEACPFEALAMSEKFELAEYDPERLAYDTERLLEVGRSTRTARIGGTGGTAI